jgi:hypothetical protein
MKNVTVGDVDLAAAKAALQFAVDQARLSANPTKEVKVRVRKRVEEREKGFDGAEAERIRGHAETVLASDQRRDEGGAVLGPRRRRSAAVWTAIRVQKFSAARAWMRHAPEGVSRPGHSAAAAVMVEATHDNNAAVRAFTAVLCTPILPGKPTSVAPTGDRDGRL